MSFLSGLPEGARKRRLILSFQVFVDDSGGKGHSLNFVMAGLAAPAESWARFADEWRDCLARHPRVCLFKMREAARMTGEFRNWSVSDRDAKLRALARIINRHAWFVTFSGVNINDHAETWALSNDKPLNEVYFWPFHNSIHAAALELWDRGLRERFEVVFDEQVIFGPRAKLWYPVIRETTLSLEPELHSIMPADPMFKTDDEFLPLQAADLFAWCMRNGTDNPSDLSFEWLLEELRSVDLSEYSHIYDRERILSVDKKSYESIRDGKISRALAEKYRELFGYYSKRPPE
jgi:Protein of unknown function (DUF3800)